MGCVLIGRQNKISLEATVLMLKKDSDSSDNIWAKGGQLTCSISPLGTAGSLDGVRAKGSYAHASKTGTISTSIAINPITKRIGITFRLSVSGTVTTMGEVQKVFYNDARVIVE